MSFFSIPFRAFLVMVLFASVFSFGSLIPLQEIPRLYQLNVFQSEKDPQHYILLGKDSIYGDSGRWYVLDVRNGMITSPQLRSDSLVYWGGGFDFKYESGEWLYLMKDSLRGYGSATQEVTASGLIDSRRGREPFVQLPLTEQLLQNLGVSHLVAQEFLTKLGSLTVREKFKTPVAPSKDILLFVVHYDRDTIPDTDIVRSMEKSIPRLIWVDDILERKSNTLYIWAFETQSEAIQTWIQKTLQTQPILFKKLSETEGVQAENNHVSSIIQQSSFVRIPQILSMFESLEKKRFRPEEFTESLAIDLGKLLSSLEFDLQLANNVTKGLEKWDRSASAQKKITTNFIQPILDLQKRGYQILDRIQTPLARKILLFNGKETESRLQFLIQASGQGVQNYFQTWLQELRQRVQWIQSASSQELRSLRPESRSGSTFHQFPFFYADFLDFKNGESIQNPVELYRVAEVRNFFPLKIFGLYDHPQSRQDFIQFVLDMDKIAEFQKMNFHSPYQSSYVGSLTLQNVLNALSFTGREKKIFEGSSDFSQALYYKQVMMIITELLNTSRVTITNTATYLSILNTALNLQKDVMEEFGNVPNAKSKSKELNELTSQLLELQQSIQVRLLRGVFHESNLQSKTCDVIFRGL